MHDPITKPPWSGTGLRVLRPTVWVALVYSVVQIIWITNGTRTTLSQCHSTLLSKIQTQLLSQKWCLLPGFCSTWKLLVLLILMLSLVSGVWFEWRLVYRDQYQDIVRRPRLKRFRWQHCHDVRFGCKWVDMNCETTSDKQFMQIFKRLNL